MKKLLPLLIVALGSRAQIPSFEVASIKRNPSAEGLSSIRLTAGLIRMDNVSLQKAILSAYDIPDDRDYALVGPDWLTAEHFDIQAKFAAETPTQQVRQMMQTLLAERFKLTLHQETRQLPIYALVVAKNGPKIRAVEDGQSGTSGGPGRLEATKITMQKLADLLTRMIGRQVADATGLTGVFNFTLEWSPLDPQDGAAAAADGPSIFTALQEQLGLKLEKRKAPVEILVVDHIEKAPAEN